MRVEWVHPSWRDLVIDHLAGDMAARARFLSCCSTHGLLLALSFGGGEAGARDLPLLRSDADWDTLTDRLYRLAPELDTAERQAVLDNLGRAIATLDPPARYEAIALARAFLERLATLWTERKGLIPLPELEAWLIVTGRLPEEPPPPALPDLSHVWAELLPVSTPSLEDREELERFVDWLTLADLLSEYSPDTLRRLGFEAKAHLLTGFVGAVLDAHGGVDPSVSSLVRRALDRVHALAPELGKLGSYVSLRLNPARTRLPGEAPEPLPPLPGERPGFRLFDVTRVLEDL